MEFFPDGLVVRLRSRIRGGLYLYARDDGLGVAVSPRRSSPNTGWVVRRFQHEGTDCFVLRSSATGRCLAAAESAADPSRRRAAAVQRDHVVRGEARNGQLVTALAFVPGRGKGITTLPLHLQDQKDAGAVLDGDDHGDPSANDDVEPQPAGVVVVGADDLVPEEEQDAEAAALEDQQAQEEEHADQDEQPQQLLVAQPQVQDNADGDPLGGQAQGDGQQAAVDQHAQFLQQQVADTLKYLSETYEVMEKKHGNIRLLIEQKGVTAQEAAARRDWSDVDKLHRALHKNIAQDIALYDTKPPHFESHW